MKKEKLYPDVSHTSQTTSGFIDKFEDEKLREAVHSSPLKNFSYLKMLRRESTFKKAKISSR